MTLIALLGAAAADTSLVFEIWRHLRQKVLVEGDGPAPALGFKGAGSGGGAPIELPANGAERGIQWRRKHDIRFCGLTFELTGPLRRDGLARVGKMYRVPQAGPRRPAVAGPVVQRGVRPRRFYA